MSKGLPIFKLANSVIKGWFPTSKSGKNSLIPFIGAANEEGFLIYSEYHPGITHIERADIDEEFANRYKLYKSVLSPIIIPYEFNGKEHLYYPDFIMHMNDGRTIIVEVGDKEEKESYKAQAKAKAAIAFCSQNGWDYWLVKSDNILSKIKRDNLTCLKSYDKVQYKNEKVLNEILLYCNAKQVLSIEGIVNALSMKFSPLEIELCLYEYLNYCAKNGILCFDYDNEILTRGSNFAILNSESRTIIPPDIHTPYNSIFENTNIQESESDDGSCELVDNFGVKRNYIDSSLLPQEIQQQFLNKRAAVLEVIYNDNALTVAQIAMKYGLKRPNLYALVDKYKTLGEEALIPYRKYEGAITLIPVEVQDLLVKIHKNHPRWTAIQIHESPELKKGIVTLCKNTDKFFNLPSYYQVYRFLKKLLEMPEIDLVQQNRKKQDYRATTLGKWVRSIEHRLDQVQVDATWMDIKIVAENRTEVASKVWAVALIDVKTSIFLGYALSLKSPMEEEYMMALKCCIEPKDKLLSKFKCENDWPSSGIPRKILSDNGKIFISKRTTDVLVNRFRIIEEIAPPYAPSVKGSIEALFRWVENKLVSRMPGFTKGQDSEVVKKEALSAGITFEDFEEIFVKAIVDSYNIEWDDLRGQTAYNLWINEDRQNGLLPPMWLGTSNELKLLLMKEDRGRKVDRHGVSFRGRFYQNITMLKSLIGENVSIRYDKRDISVIYIYKDNGTYHCEAYCEELRGKRLSIWEDDIIRKDVRIQREFHNNISNKNLGMIISNARTPKSKKMKERDVQLIEQTRIYSEQDIHLDSVKDAITNTSAEIVNGNEEVTPVSMEFKPKKKKLVIRDI